MLGCTSAACWRTGKGGDLRSRTMRLLGLLQSSLRGCFWRMRRWRLGTEWCTFLLAGLALAVVVRLTRVVRLGILPGA